MFAQRTFQVMGLSPSGKIGKAVSEPVDSSSPILKTSDEESDGTSMTTASSSATPSPYNINSDPALNMHDKSRHSSSEMVAGTNDSSPCLSHDETNAAAAFSILSPRNDGSPRRRHTPTNSNASASPIYATSPSADGGHNHSIHSGSWTSDSDDDIFCEDNETYYRKTVSDSQFFHRHSSDSPRNSQPAEWSISQALFQDDTENFATVSFDDDVTCVATNATPPGRGTSFHRSSSDCAFDTTDHDTGYDHERKSWSAACSPPSGLSTSLASAGSEAQHPIRTRKTRRGNKEHGVEHDFHIASHRRRNSTGEKKYRASPRPTLSCPTRDSPHLRICSDGLVSQNHHSSTIHSTQLSHSHSKSQKLKQQHRNMIALELPGLSLSSLEERLSMAAGHHPSAFHNNQNNSVGVSQLQAATVPLASVSSHAAVAWRRLLLCRLRVTTFIWALVMIGFTSLGRSAMMTGSSFSFSGLETQSQRLEVPRPPTGGLRGSLLMNAVSQHGSHSQDLGQSTKKRQTSKAKDQQPKKTTKKDKRQKVDKNMPTNKQKDRVNSTDKKTDKRKHGVNKKIGKRMKSTIPPGVLKPRGVIKPPALDSSAVLPQDQRRMFEYHDPLMFAPFAGQLSKKSKESFPKRVVMFHYDGANTPHASPRLVEQYPADFTDNTQFYSQFDSSDERLQKMEMRAPYSEGECVPMQDWQTTYHPSCNGVHELGVEYMGEQSSETDVQLFGTKGYWRYAWKLDLRKEGHRHHEEGFGDRVVLKTLKFRHDFEDAHFEHDRVDAVAMERLTASPHVINVFGFCGHSVLTEYANGPRLGELADKSKSKPLERLKIARDIANGLADVHGIDDPSGNNATFVHLDINPANVISIGGTLKLNDFNIGIIRRWNTTSQRPCGFPAQYPNPQWRSPEEARGESDLTEKVDVFSMGHIFFRLICGHEPWNKLEAGGKPSKDLINEKVKLGKLPTIPDFVMKTADPEVAAIRDVMLDCYKANPKERPSARAIALKLGSVLEKLSK